MGARTWNPRARLAILREYRVVVNCSSFLRSCLTGNHSIDLPACDPITEARRFALHGDSSRNRNTTRNISTSKNELETDRVLLWMIVEFARETNKKDGWGGWMDGTTRQAGRKAFDIVHKGITSWERGSINKMWE